MKEEFFTNLPSHITIDILSRLSVPTILLCKSVCKPWLDLLTTQEFINHHLSNSSPGLAVFPEFLSSQLYEFKDEHNLEHHELHYNILITNLKLPLHGFISTSANGVLLWRNANIRPNALAICNPITREYIEIHSPQDFDYTYPQVVTFGFGASRVSNEHKLVRVFHDCILDQDTYRVLQIPKSECHVYTVGAGSWRRVAPPAPFVYSCHSVGAFLNGNLHWLVLDLDNKPVISCFDLETEMFRVFSAPPPHQGGGLLIDVFALGESLCVCDNSSEDEIVIWLMKEYGDEKSWRKEYVISKIEDYKGQSYEVVRPLKVFKDGDMLMACGEFSLFYSSSKTRTISRIEMFGYANSVVHTSSFLSLTSFGTENVSYF
ncbi:F-box protein At3g07870-like [Salvia hispanica]|uniref:F-box protein At3g07870-like n=1 Tax=Salvia hispanica TaxID=49212 RepID=UPI002009D748|nr:F-box protein At3g07870-like [Salvia hispanica]